MEEPESEPSPKGKGGKADKRRQQLMVAGTVVLVVIGYLTLKKMSGASSGVSGTAASSGGDSGGASGSSGTAGVDAGNQSQLDSLTSQVGILNSKVTDLAGKIPGVPAVPTGTNTPVIPKPPIVHNTPPKSPTAHKPSAPAKSPAKAATTGTYTVKKGDNLTSIGRRFGESWQALYGANKKVVGSNPNLILPGQKLKVNEPAANKPAAEHAVLKAAPKTAHPPTHG